MARCEVVDAHVTERGVGSGQAATDEASLLAMARESEEGEVLVAPGTEIVFTKLLYLCEEPNDYCKKNFHCERRPSSDPRAAAGAWG